MRCGWTLAGLVLIVSSSAAGAASFTAAPAAARDGDAVKITFAVSGPTDVEVSVLDAGGKVVSHLAAGVLGGAAPPPAPLAAGLAQSLAWDGKDDLGRRVEGDLSNFKVRVRLGLGVKLDGLLDERNQWVGDLRGLATDDRGNLYVYSSIVRDEGGRSPCLQVFDRAGAYLRTIMPMPANLPKSRLLPFNRTDVWANKLTLDPPGAGGHFRPRNYSGVWPHFYSHGWGMGYLLPRVGRDGVLMSRSDVYLNLAAITTDGGCAGEIFERIGFKQKLWGNAYQTTGQRCVVRSPDEKHIYLCGFGRQTGKEPTDLDPAWPVGRIYRMKDECGSFFDKWVDLPDGDAPAAAGAACFDGDGNLMVFNAGTGKAVVLDADGKQIGEFPALVEVDGEATAPARLLCHRKTGEIYADYLRPTGKGPVHRRKLVKLAPWKKGAAKVAEMLLPDHTHPWGNWQVSKTDAMALDGSADPAVIWVGTAGVGTEGTGARYRAPCYLLRIEDRGKDFVKTADLIDRCRDGLICKTRLAVHPETELVIYNDGYNGIGGVNGLTGEKVALPVKIGQDMTVGLDGNWYFHIGGGFYTSPICRYDKDLKPIPVPGQAAKDVPANNMLGRVYSRRGAGFCTVGLAADQKGRVFSLQMWSWATYGVAVYGPDGKSEDSGRLADVNFRDKTPLKERKDPDFFKSVLIGDLGGEVGGIQLDRQGNVYVGKKIMPPGHKPPAGYEHWMSGYFHGTGTIIKFAPSGGAIVDAKDAEGKQGLAVEPKVGRSTPMFAEGATRLYPGLGCMSGRFGCQCMCRQPMFQVDGWGRIFMPNAILNHVRVVDNAGNEILTFGHYGNIDSRGNLPGSLIKTPDVPLGWPQAVGVSNRAVYVADVLNRRIVRLKKTYAAEAACDLR